jgi:hypothetical protein
MDNFQFWLYVIIGLIYLISRMRKKPQGGGEADVPAGNTDARQERSERRQTRQPERQPTFEELLREIVEGKSEPEAEPERRPDPVHQRPVYKNYDDEIEEEVDSREVIEDVNYDYRKQDSIYAQYEGSKREAFARPSLEETMNLDTTDMSYGKFKAFDIHEKRNIGGEYLADLNDPEFLKKAFVMSEILKRKF